MTAYEQALSPADRILDACPWLAPVAVCAVIIGLAWLVEPLTGPVSTAAEYVGNAIVRML